MKSFGSPFQSKTVLSPRVPTSASSSRRSSLLPGGTRNVSSRYSISGQSNQSIQIVCKTPYHTVESFGLSLPVLVTEVLTFSDRSTAASVSMSADGWAWFVCGRRLLIWQYRQPPGHTRPASSQCQELTLPPSDLAHRASLVSVFTPRGNQVPSCIAVSPEGTVRYWPSVLHSGASVEHIVDLQGQECDQLADISPYGCVLATTTATVVLVQPLVQSGRHTLICRPLRSPHGWLGGIGRRMSSLIFGGLPTAHSAETKLVKIVAVRSGETATDDWNIYVLAEHSLQKWLLSSGETETLLFECDISVMVREGYCGIWQDIVAGSELDIWLLDMQSTEDGLMLLAAALNSSVSQQLHYALGKLPKDRGNVPAKFSSFTLLKHTTLYQETEESEVLGYQLLLSAQGAYLFNEKSVIALSAANYGDEPDIVEFMSPGDRLLGGAICGNVPIFFSKIHGLVSLSSVDMAPNDFLNSSVSVADFPTATDITVSQATDGHVAVSMTDFELEELSISKDSVARMRAAFIYHIKNKNKSQSEEIIEDLFPEHTETINEIDNVIDTVIVKVSEDLINDIPAADPRWSEVRSSAVSIGSSSSLQILHQLEGKQKALDLFVQFLKDVKLWDRFSAVSIRRTPMPTSYVLGEHAEKVVAAISLHLLQPQYSTVIETNIKLLLADERKTPTGALNYFDIFYQEVTNIHKIFHFISKWSEDIAHSDRRPQEVAKLLADSNAVILSVLQDVIQFRQQRAEMFSPTSPLPPSITEYIPWTAAVGKSGVRDALSKQRKLTLECGSSITGDIVLKNQLFDQLVNLVDIILDGHKCRLESIRGTDKFEGLFLQYERERMSLIQPFLTMEEYERAAILAEKYCDFEILIEICELTENQERIEQYTKKFADQNFSHFLFNWYIRENKQGRLLEYFKERKVSPDQQHSLSEFLTKYPHLSWIANVFNNEFGDASQTLHQLAKDETELLCRKKSMLSLSKLAHLAAGRQPTEENKELQSIDDDLTLIAHQEDLPETVFIALGFDYKKQKVLTPAEIIRLYISEENHMIQEYDFKKALDLLDYIPDEFEKSELRQSIWCRAILHDKWIDKDTTSPVDVIQSTMFYKVAEVACLLDEGAEELLPPVDRLLEAPEIGNLKESSSFQYLLKAAYEHIERTLLTV